MGKQKYQKEIESLFEKSPVISYNSLQRIIKNKNYSKQLIRNLILKGKIKKLAKGFYSKFDENSLAVYCFKPSYLGLQDALSFHNLWEQETIPIIITSKKIRQGIRKIMDMNVLIRRIDNKYLFGFEYYKEGNFIFPYSDIEKTFIDLVYFRQKLSKEVLKEIKKKIDKKRLSLYLKNYSKRFRREVMNKV